MADIHPTADVERDAHIGAGTRVWHLAHVRTGARIGDRCTIGRNVFVDQDVVVGDRCKVQNNVSLYRGVILEDDVFVGPSVVFTNDRHPRVVGEWQLSQTRVKQGASLGAGAVLVCGTTVGRGALVGAGAVVTKDVEDWTLVTGNPARPQGLVCVHGRRTSRPGGYCESRIGGTAS